MKTLIVSGQVPTVHYGGGQRLLMWRRIFSALGDTKMLTLHPRDVALDRSHGFAASDRYPSRLSRFGWIMRHLLMSDYRHTSRLSDVFAQIKAEYSFDLIFFHTLYAASASPRRPEKIFIDLDEVPPITGKAQRLVAPVRKRMYHSITSKFDQLYTIRRDENVGAARHVSFIPAISNSISMRDQSSGFNRELLFVGSPSWEPNKAAIDWLRSKQIMSFLSSNSIKLKIAGKGTTRYSDEKCVDGLGFVDDLSVHYQSAVIVVCPVFGENGANIKLAEAIQHGCAVLASRDAAKAFSGVLTAGRNVEIFDSTSEFINKVDALLKDRRHLQAIRDGARETTSHILNIDHMTNVVRDDCARCGLNPR